jgi:hypothetical protein
MSIHALDPSHCGFELWRGWSESSKKFDMKDQVRVWLSFTSSKAVKLNYQSIFSEAAKHGYMADEDVDADDDGHITIACLLRRKSRGIGRLMIWPRFGVMMTTGA